MDWDKVNKELEKKLDPKNVKPAKPFGPKGDYIEGWRVMAEANAIFGFDGWSYEVMDCSCVHQGPRPIGKDKKNGFGVTYTSRIRAVVDGVIRDDVGAGHGYDIDVGLAHESAIKEAVTDGLKRALRGFGNRFGLALYDESRENVGVEPERISETDLSDALYSIGVAMTREALKEVWLGFPPAVRADADVLAAKDARKADLEAGQ